jgi:uncharacterized phage protein gp47/JayE
MNFQKDFDTLFAAMLTDWQNQFPNADLSKGSLIYMKSACLASALWGLYKYQDWIKRQMFPDTADTPYLEHHGWTYDINRKTGESDSALLARILDYIRRPPAGGNKYDYIRWAKEVDNVANAWCIPLADGLGTVTVIILANTDTTGNEIASTSARIGVTTSASSGKLIDTGATFTTEHAAAAGDIVENPLRQTRTTVVTVDSASEITLQADIFKYEGEPYIIHSHTGVNTTATAYKLIDSAGAFTDTTYTVREGDIAENITESTQALVVSVDSAIQITLDTDIFVSTGKTYVIRGLLGEVKKYIDPLRPVTASQVSVINPTVISQAVTLSVTGTNLDNTALADEITAFLNSMIPGQILYKTRLVQIVMDAGADNVTISVPSTDVVPSASEMLRAGTITIS